MNIRTKTHDSLNRRTFLRGLGASLALPALEAMSPALGTAVAAGAKGRSSAQPLRLAYIYFPNGANMTHWRPAKTGNRFDLPATLSPLSSFQRDLQVLGGLDHKKAEPNGDGGGDHARANATFLTGVQANKSQLGIGVSADQLAAEEVGTLTRLRSLELSTNRARQSGNCDSGYSCAYQYNLSWKTATTPMAPEVNPRLVFERLFGAPGKEGSYENRRRLAYRKSVLDFVMDDAKRLQHWVGTEDKAKLEEYLTTVREMEQRIEKAEDHKVQVPDYELPKGIPGEYKEHIRMMYDMMALAFQTDSTRISTFLLAHEGSNRSFREVGVSDGHHGLSHHGGDENKKKKIQLIDQFYTEQFAYFLGKLKGMKEGSGSVLDNSMIVYGSGISDGQRHGHRDLPLILAGGGGGSLKPGRHVRFGDTPMTNLHLALLDRMGVNARELGDSTGVLKGI